VYDKDGGTNQKAVVISSANANPTATGVTGPTSLVEGSTGTFSLANVTDAPGDLPTLHYSFATTPGGLAASYVAAGVLNSFNFTPVDNGSFTIYGMVFDKDGGSNTYQIACSASNAAPTVTGMSGPTSLTTGGSGTYALTGVADVSSVDA